MVSTRSTLGITSPRINRRGRQVTTPTIITSAMQRELLRMIEEQFATIRSEIATRSPSVSTPISQTKDPRDRIKVNEVPKYDGTDKKGVDEFIQEFIEYC